MIHRKIIITVSDPDSIWKEIEQDIFSDFSFQLPTIFPDQVPGDISANISYEFIPEDPNLANYIKPGLDPFLSPFFSIRVQKISDDPIKYQSFQRWIDVAKNNSKPWCVFLIQERFLFISPNAGLFSQLDSIPLERLFTIQYKSPLKLADQQKEQIQTKFQDIITESFIVCDSNTMDIIHLDKYPASHTARLRVWRFLMFFYYGFLETAIKGFYEIYTEFSKRDLKCDIIPPIEPSWITLYPFINGGDDISILIFALSGCFASYYIKRDYYKILELFMRNLAILQSKSSINQILTSNWASQSLEVMIDLDFSSLNDIRDNINDENQKEKTIEIHHLDITEQLLMQLFKNRLTNGSQKQIDEAYHKLMIRLSEKKFSRTALNVLYSNNKLFNELTECWNFGQTAAFELVEEAIKEKNYSRIQFFAKPLFFDFAPEKMKLKLFSTISKLDSEVLFKDPFSCHMKFQSDAFYTTIKNDYTFYINIKCDSKTIRLFPREYDSATLSLRMQKNEDKNEIGEITHEFTSTNIKIDDFQITAFLNENGKWIFNYLEIRKGSLTFNWQINEEHCIYISKYKRPNINATFPSLIGFCQLLPITLSVDFATIEKKNTEFKLFFDSPSLTIPDQHGNSEIQFQSSKTSKTIISPNTKSVFNITNSVLRFDQTVDRSNFDCDSKFIARINCKQNGQIDSSNLHVIASVSGAKYEFIFNVIFVFPIECSLRFISEKFAHICLRNTAAVPFIIESAEMLPSTWGRQIINAGEELFLIGQRSYENDILKLFIKDESGSSIAMSWDINDKMMRPILKAEIKGSSFCGRSIKIKLLDVPQGEFYVHNTKNFIVSGITKIEDFKGGNLVFYVIPLKLGLLRLPFVSINHVSYVIQQEYIKVDQPKGTLLSPLVKM